MAEERIDIVITERGARVVQRNMNQIGQTARNVDSAVTFLKRSLATLGVAFGARELLRTLDTYTNLQNRLRATGLEAQNLTGVYNELLGVANDTRSSLEGSVELYSRLAISAKDLGTSQQELIQFTKSLNQAIILSGASATEAQAGLIQLSQGMASGTLRGDELRSVLEQLPAVADVIAKQLGVTRGELRTMGEEGKITATTILDAFQSARGELEERFGKTVPTISQSFQVLRNNFVNLIGEFDKATGTTALLSQGLLFIAENLETIAKLALSVAAGFALIGGGAKAISLATTAVRALTAAIAANPIGLLLVALTSVITALTLFRDEISLGIDETTTLGDLMRALGELFVQVFGGLYDAAKNTFGPLFDLIGNFVGDVEFSFAGVLRLTAKVVDGFYGFWFGVFKAVVELFKNLPGVLGDLVLSGINSVLRSVDVDFQFDNKNEGAAAAFGEQVGTAFTEGFNSVNFAKDTVESLLDRAQEIGKARVAAEEAASAAQGGITTGSSRGGLSGDALKKLQKELEQLTSSYDKVFAAQQEYQKGLDILDRAEKAGLITGERKAEVLEIISDQLRDALDPLAAINRQLATESELLGLTSDQREVENQLRSIQDDLRGQGLILGEAELQQLREKLTLLQEETKLEQARSDVLNSIQGPQEEFINQIRAINQLLAEGLITQGEATRYLVEQNDTLLQGTIEAQQAWVSQYQETYRQIDELRQADLISEQTANQLKARAQYELTQKQLQNAQTFFGSLATLSRSENKKLAAIGKAAAVTQATIDGVLAVQKALSSAPPPVNFALAAAVGVAAAANVAQILSQNTQGFAFGGDFAVGGTGGTDSQLVAFRATPGETVSVRTPTQNRDQARQAGSSGESGGASPRIINVLDPALVADYLSTPDGEQVLINTIRKNSDSMKQVLSEG